MAEKAAPGVFEARVSDYGVGKTKEGKPQVLVRFEFNDSDNDKHFITWYGSFTEKATERTCESLAICGWTTNSPADLAKGAGSGILDEQKAVSITLKNEEWNDKVTLKVTFVNAPGGGGFRNAIEHADAVQAFSGMNLEGVAAAARKKHETKPIPNMAPKAKTAEFDANEPIPF